MQTTNTTHVQLCSVAGCMETAEVTYAFGNYATSPKGCCSYHTVLDLPGNATARKEQEENELLKTLGLVF